MERNVYEWYVVYTRQGMEKKVEKELAKRKIECYCPVNRIETKWWTLKKTVEQPLFTSCVFVKISEQQVPALRKINGVVNVLYWLGKPAVVREDEIHMIKNFLCNHRQVTVEKTTVKAFNYVYGNSTAPAEPYKVELPTIGYRIVAGASAPVKVVSMQGQAQQAEMPRQYSNAG